MLKHNLKKELLKEASRRITKVVGESGSGFQSELLQEGETRVSRVKSAALEKESMAYWADTPDANNASVNFRVEELQTGKKVEQIRAEIENIFAGFMKDRTGAVSGELGGEQQGRATRRTTIAPQFAGDTVAGQLEEDKATARLGGMPRDARGGSIYFRWGWKRTVLPSNGGPEEKNTKNMLDEIDQLVGDNFMAKLVSSCDELNFVPCAYCHTMDATGATSDNMSNFVLDQSQRPFVLNGPTAGSTNPKEMNNPLRNAARQISAIEDMKNAGTIPKNIEPLTFGSRKKRSTGEYAAFGGDEDAYGQSIKKFTQHSILVRCLFFKIVSGYTLDEGKFKAKVIEHLTREVRRQKEQGRIVTKDHVNKIRHSWLMQYKQAICAFRNIEAAAPEQFHIIQTKEDKDQDRVFPVDDQTGVAEGHQRVNYLGMPMQGKGEKINPRSYRCDFGREKIPFNFLHLQMLLECCTLPAPENRQKNAPQMDPHSFVDPRHPIRFRADGMSDISADVLAQAGWKTIPLAPLMMAQMCDNCGHANRSSSRRSSCLKCGYPLQGAREVVDWDIKNCNMGGGHLVKLGDETDQLLRTYGTSAKQAWFALAKTRDQMSPKLKSVFNLIANNFFSAEAMLQNLQIYNTPEKFQKFIESQKSRGEDSEKSKSTVFNATQGFEVMWKYGYYLAKMLDLLDAVISANCATQVTTETGRTISLYGQNVGRASGLGGGGEILLSVKYAYRASIEQWAGGSEAEKKVRRENREQKLPAGTSVIPSEVHQTNLPGNLDPNLIEPSPSGQEGPGLGVKWLSQLTYYLGANSDKTGGRFVGRAGGSWDQVVSELRMLYPGIEEDAGHTIWELNVDLDNLYHSSKIALNNAREKIGLAAPIKIIDNEGKEEEINVTTLDEGGLPQSAVKTETPPAQPAATSWQQDVGQMGQGVGQWGGGLDPNAPKPPPPTPGQPVEPTQGDEVTPNKTMPKPFPMSAPTYLVRKKDKSRNLLRRPMLAEMGIDTLVKAADKIDAAGYQEVADKIEVLLQKLVED